MTTEAGLVLHSVQHLPLLWISMTAAPMLIVYNEDKAPCLKVVKHESI